MKKAYSKPDIVFENFSLSTNIAAGCEVKTNFAQNQCGYKFAPGIVIFLEGVNGCVKPVVDGDGQFNGICYHNPSDDNNIFSS